MRRYWTNEGDVEIGAWVTVHDGGEVRYTADPDGVEFRFSSTDSFDIRMGERTLIACIAEFPKALESMRQKRAQADADDEDAEDTDDEDVTSAAVTEAS